ncbi:rhomboid family intramembrane serine protease [Gilvimarinus polysaccharolyticus]|uniref:rhomboid family intramembrane serine protease n=1 Tax=Gilvimarinus polysaccharolyticus TaxID=863921 RepID=UPI000A8C60FE|nr:rhomboid family intramembrane serine protease [Gilvimarinus polysaccharolyticus]
MSWNNVSVFPLSDDLTLLVRELRARGVPHRVVEINGQQNLQVPDGQLVEPVSQLVQQWRDDELAPVTDEAFVSTPVQSPKMLSPWRTPITLLLVALSALGFAVVETKLLQPWLGYLTFFPLEPVAGGYRWQPFSEALARAEYWRLITPAFLHFGVFHIVFNSLWMWDLGRRLEFVVGKFSYLLFFLLTATASNVAQYFWADQVSLFGGMSGVVYALVGYIWIRQWLDPHPVLAVPRGIIVFMLAWQVLCLSGAVDYFLAGGIANGAHVGGLLAGMFIAGAFALAKRAGFVR